MPNPLDLERVKVTVKTCRLCGHQKPVAEFKTGGNGSTGTGSQCKQCVNAIERELYRQNPAKRNKKQSLKLWWLRRKHPERFKARDREAYKRKRSRYVDPIKQHVRQTLRNAVAAGRVIKPLACESCHQSGGVRIEAHHPDYSKPFDVQWLCGPCHRLLHSKYAEDQIQILRNEQDRK